ncbi:MAG: Rpn family recombination-promoting nuclease/putative transposase [Spirochaetota bacterium]
MSGEIHNPHDKFFKTWFSRPENLIPFLETALPADIFALLDVSTLAISDGTFIDEEHREHFSDLSASIQLQGREARLYILVEHKSYADKWALLQILRYMVQTWTRDARTEAAVPLLPFGR